MPLHPNIDSKLLSKEGKLLSEDNSLLVLNVENFIRSLDKQINEILHNQAYCKELKSKYGDLLEKFSDPFSHIDSEILPQDSDSKESYIDRVIQVLTDFAAEMIDSDSKAFINQLKKALIENSYAESPCDIYQNFLEILDIFQEKYAEEIQDSKRIDELQRKISDINSLEEDNYQNKQKLQEIISEFKRTHTIDFELDDDYQLVKISKRSKELNFSVIYTQLSQNTTPKAYALYHGGENEILGEGGFGKVKLCQDINSGEWLAIKIQKKIMKAPSFFENSALSFFGRFKGEALREKKYYSVQTLLPGVDLYKYITQKESLSLESRITIAKQAAILVGEFHKNYLHRDLKPENFLWDELNHELYLCDFGLACQLDSPHDGVEDFSGSGTFLAPEIDDSRYSGKVLYSKKSDIYALGKVFQELFSQGEDIPSEIEALIAEMTATDVEKRLQDSFVIEERLRDMEQRYTTAYTM